MVGVRRRLEVRAIVCEVGMRVCCQHRTGGIVAAVLLVACVACSKDANEDDSADAGEVSRGPTVEEMLESLAGADGRFVATEDPAPGSMRAAIGPSADCGFTDDTSEFDGPTLGVTTGSYRPGQYPIQPEIETTSATRFSRVLMLGIDQPTSRTRFGYPAVSGHVQFREDARNSGETLEVDVDADFPEPLLARLNCRINRDPPVPCDCLDRGDDEIYSCKSSSKNAACCFDGEHYGGTRNIDATFVLERCGSESR